tara:strand:+ start:2834 stop:3142 length:309 start_codon:yes stop_codon:yes gene_type:complete
MCYIIYNGENMYLEPKNRHLLVFPLEKDQEEKRSIILPDDYKRPSTPYISCDVLGIADDCKLTVQIGDRVIVERSMIQEVNANGETNYLVLENYIYGRLQDE